MTKRKNKVLFAIIIVIIAAVIIATILPIVSNAINKKKDIVQQEQTNNNLEQNNSQDNREKYYTVSTGGNVDIGVIFMNPIEEDSANLVFKVMLNTHSVDLSGYYELDKYVELRTNEATIKDQFIWESESADSHHVFGTLKIKNEYNGKLILADKTEYIKIVFKSIAGVEEREHVYYKDALK